VADRSVVAFYLGAEAVGKFALAGLVSMVIGYILLGQGSISAAPALLVLGYCILVPLALV